MNESKTENLKGVIMGFGNMGQTHLARYKNLTEGEVAVIETDGDKTILAEAAGFNVFTSLLDIPELRSYDFIDICTPTNLHFQHIQEAMKYQKPIFVEKPVVRTLDEVNKLRALAQNYLHPIFVGEVEQYNPGLSEFLNYYGHPAHIDIFRNVNLEFFLKGTKPWFLDTNLSGGIVLDLMIHDINLLIVKYGVPSVRNVEGSRNKYDCVDQVTADLLFEGFDATLHSNWTSQKEDSPIAVSINIKEPKGRAIKVECNNYVIREANKEPDAFERELTAFLQSISVGKTLYNLELYLNGIEMAHKIIAKI